MRSPGRSSTTQPRRVDRATRGATTGWDEIEDAEARTPASSSQPSTARSEAESWRMSVRAAHLLLGFPVRRAHSRPATGSRPGTLPWLPRTRPGHRARGCAPRRLHDEVGVGDQPGELGRSSRWRVQVKFTGQQQGRRREGRQRGTGGVGVEGGTWGTVDRSGRLVNADSPRPPDGPVRRHPTDRRRRRNCSPSGAAKVRIRRRSWARHVPCLALLGAKAVAGDDVALARASRAVQGEPGRWIAGLEQAPSGARDHGVNHHGE